jgi:hypothetical protein
MKKPRCTGVYSERTMAVSPRLLRVMNASHRVGTCVSDAERHPKASPQRRARPCPHQAAVRAAVQCPPRPSAAQRCPAPSHQRGQQTGPQGFAATPWECQTHPPGLAPRPARGRCPRWCLSRSSEQTRQARMATDPPSLWAMVRTVRSRNLSRMVCWMTSSVSESTEAVASSEQFV